MRSVLLVCLLLCVDQLLALPQTSVVVVPGLAAAALGAAALGALAGAGAARRRSSTSSKKRKGRDVSDADDGVTQELVDLAAVQDASECAQKFICLLAAADSLSAMESDILEATKLKGNATPKIFLAALEAGAERGATDCAAAYRNCPQTRSQLNRFVNDVMDFTETQFA